MRVLVTGSSGHVGGAIASHLMTRGYQVVGLSRRLTKSTRMLSHVIAADIGRPGLLASLSDSSPCQAIVHAAASLDMDPYTASIPLTNGLGTQQLLQLAECWKVASFVFLSSLPLVGKPLHLPVTEEHPTSPGTAYHASKLFGEHLCSVAGDRGVPAVSLRLTSPVGPGMRRNGILAVFVRRALSDEPLELVGEGRRGQDYVDVRDIAAAVESCLNIAPAGVMNIASGRCISNLELARNCVEFLDSSSEIRFSGIADPQDEIRWQVSIERAAHMLGYRPRHSMQDSIAAVADDVRDLARAELR